MQVTRHQDSFVTAARHSFETPTIAAKARADPTLEADRRSTDSDGAETSLFTRQGRGAAHELNVSSTLQYLYLSRCF